MYYYNLLYAAVNTIRFLIPPWADCLLPFSSEKWEKKVNPINPACLVEYEIYSTGVNPV